MQTGVPAAGMAMAPAVIEEASRKRKEAPRWYVTEKEFEATSSYMRGRLQPAKVNAALDELAVHAMNNAKLLSSLKGGGGKLAPAERKRATDLLHNVAGKDGIKGHFWFLDSDLREGTAIKLDKPGKSMLTLLRHLGRLQEIRCNIDGVGTTVYVMVEDPRRL
ncbi:Spindle and kinetochore-associated protein 1 [Pleodorina starrii]|uniref:Spindle and kinetochore-associated protein 1 n=1 Tax=Pleodorina starrii TaxID=330485 RepID=A0A9W6EXD3_9CHLO|nr:Spindle and kinetochore-associated protein 1 [Pleodorina starrii]